MEDPMETLKNSIPKAFLGIPPEKKMEVMKSINKAQDEITESDNQTHYLNFLKDQNDLGDVYHLIRNKKLSKTQIRKKIKSYLKNPEDLNKFLQAILDSKESKKDETKEATGSGSAGGYSMPLFSGEESDISGPNKKVPTVREQTEKVETKEATGSSSTGQYSQPAIWAKSMKKQDWKGASTKWMPGAKRVQVKKKCKTFPYCNQGDIKALKIFESESVQNAIDSVSSSYGYNKNYISEIVFREIRKRQN